MSRPIVVAVCTLAFVVVAALGFGPPLKEQRSVTVATVTPPPLHVSEAIAVPPGQLACSSDAVLSPTTQVAQVLADQPVPTPPLSVIADAPGYASPPRRIEGGASGRVALHGRITPPPREVFGRVCVRNDGDEPLTLVGTTESRTESAANTTVGGEPIEADMALTLLKEQSVTLLEFLPEMLERMSTFRGFVGWLTWPLLAMVIAGVPGGLLYVIYRAGLTDDRKRRR